MGWYVELELVEDWMLGLDDKTYDLVSAALELLSEEGPHLGRPIVDTVKGSTYKNMKELRPGSSGKSEVRMLFVFDPNRNAIFLVAGDKAGNWNKWYDENIPIAEKLYEEHLKNL
ncbi:type II toxin-antitoxin system RelE/ParE family toxin [Sinomonas humi]|uniref:Diaminopimelate decarboxylase n=1 Tax=Sinomonas humi TaxID=1338436 RepID=A0A0B2AT27_9MICC|nr:type II toxin-antitoxin system RelE/ParE family toxin [Sinomonas humi]KHL05150.1 diaminopimelate decarboxylase [Sinomonas humi]